jgi:DNA-binding CsgD family transcriptional regulator
MPRLSQRDIYRVLEALKHLHKVRDRDSFATHAAETFFAAFDCDNTIGFEINPQSGVLLSHVTHNAVNWTADKILRWSQLMDTNPLAVYHRSHPQDGSAHMTSDFLSLRQWRETAYYKEGSDYLGNERELSIVVSRRTDWAIALGTVRGKGRKDYSERDRLVANLLRPHLAHAFQTACMVTTIQRDLAAMQSIVEKLAHAIVLVESTGQISWATPRGRDLLCKYSPQPEWQQDRLPDVVHAWLRTQKARTSDVTTVPAPPSPLLISHNGGDLLIHLVAESDHDCLVLEETGAGLRTDTLVTAGLTTRECEVLTWVTQGKSNADIAIILGTSPRTIQKHLERIFQKLGVENRTAAAAAARDLARRL